MAASSTNLRLAGWSAGGLVVGGLLAMLGWGLLHPAAGTASAVTGRLAPDLTVRSFDGTATSLAGLRGRPVVLNFWASWCAPCKQEGPVLADAARANPGVQFLGADIQDSEVPARAFQGEVQAPYPVGPVTAGSYLRFGVTGPPETYFLDRGGVVRYRYLGPLDAATLRFYLGRIAA